jgi:hypothetical protein
MVNVTFVSTDLSVLSADYYYGTWAGASLTKWQGNVTFMAGRREVLGTLNVYLPKYMHRCMRKQAQPKLRAAVMLRTQEWPAPKTTRLPATLHHTHGIWQTYVCRCQVYEVVVSHSEVMLCVMHQAGAFRTPNIHAAQSGGSAYPCESTTPM